MKKAEIIKNGNLNLSSIQVDKVIKRLTKKMDSVNDKTTDLMRDFMELNKPEIHYSEIESAIIAWNNDGTKTAGELARRIIKIIKRKK